MKVIALFDMKEGATQAKVAEAIARRTEYKFPEGTKLISEYWTPVGSPAVIAVIEATEPAALMMNSLAWLDVFDVHIYPVTEWQEGAQKLGKLLTKK